MQTDAVLQEIVKKILSYKDAKKIVLFGSRARGSHEATSDIDIAIVDPAWTRDDVAMAHDLVEEEISTPLKIDILAFHLVDNDSLKERVRAEGKVLHERR
jgi:uncharacterized protein